MTIVAVKFGLAFVQIAMFGMQIRAMRRGEPTLPWMLGIVALCALIWTL